MLRNLLIMFSCFFINQSYANDKLQKQVNDAYRFAELATASIIFHELGHYVIRNFNIQKFTFEEDLADSFVVYNLLKNSKQYKSIEFYEKYAKAPHSVLMAGADIFYYRTLLGIDNKIEAYSHSTDQRRFYNYVCLMKDGNSNFFNKYIQKRQLQYLLKTKCKSRYNNLVKSWVFYLKNTWGKNEKGFYKLNFKNSEVESHKVIKKYLNREKNWIDWAMKHFMVLTKDNIIVNFENCKGKKNAYYIDKTKTIKICYEYFNELKNLRMKILKLKESL